jgi:hypothetical protein
VPKAPPRTDLRRDPTAASRRLQNHSTTPHHRLLDASGTSRKRRPAARIYHHNLNAADEGASKPCGPAGIETKPQQPPRQTANLSHVNLNTYIDSYRSALRQCNDAFSKAQRDNADPAVAAKTQPRRGTTRLRHSLPTTPNSPQQRSNPAFGTAKNGVLFSLFSRLRLRETPKNGASFLPNAV